MLKYIITIPILLSINHSFGQTTELKGQVVEKETRNPLPFATIEIYSLKTGTIADKHGDFNIKVNSKDVELDSIKFSYLAYEKVKMSIGDFLKLNNKIIPIKENPVTLDETVVIPKKYDSKIIGIKDKKPWSKQYANIFGGNLGNFIENKEKKAAWIKSVSFYLYDEGYPETPFRIRIYEVDKNKQTPGIDLLLENVVVQASKAGWCKFDISDYNIPFPVEGAFVMMEWVNSGNQYYYEREKTIHGKNGEADKIVTRKYYGQTLGTVRKKPKMIFWGKGLGKDWISYPFFYKGYINAMINAEIAFPLD